MEWWMTLLMLFGIMMVLFFTGMPIYAALLVMTMIGITMYWGVAGYLSIANDIRESIVKWTLLPMPLFILMGEIMFRTGVASSLLDAVSNWMGRLPGRLTHIAIIVGTLFGTMTGSSIGSTAMLGETLVPDMEQRGYHSSMIIGPVIVGGNLAPLIPPSSLAIFIAILAEVSVARTLLAIIMPGLLMAGMAMLYVLIRCAINPSLAPTYQTTFIPLSKKLKDTAIYILPLGFIIFMVTGVILLGIATPTEAAATGTVGSIILAAAYGKLNWTTLKSSLIDTVRLTGIMLIILMTAGTFSQILAFSGTSAGLGKLVTGLDVPPVIIVMAMHILIMFLGCFITGSALMMIFIPMFIPIVLQLGYDGVWFCVIFLINSELGGMTPPFGTRLFLMKSLAPQFSMGEIVRSTFPFMLILIAEIFLLILFPNITLWLPNLS